MALEFNQHGYLISASPAEVSLEAFAAEFVVNEHRARLFTEYKSFLKDIAGLIERPFYQWLNGSYVSKHPNPRDIDLITFVPYDCYDSMEGELRMLKKRYANLDAYFVKEYPLGHSKRFVTEFDKTEWRFLFSTDRRKREKGFVQIKF